MAHRGGARGAAGLVMGVAACRALATDTPFAKLAGMRVQSVWRAVTVSAWSVGVAGMLAAACGSSRSAAGRGAGDCGASGICNAAPSAPGDTTVVLVNDFEGAAVLGCAVAGQLLASDQRCSQAMAHDSSVQSLDGASRRLGGAKPIVCDPTGSGEVQGERAGFAIDDVAGEPTVLGQFLIWPPSRARDVVRWDTRPPADVTAVTRKAAELAKGLTYSGPDGAPVPYVLSGPIDLRGTLTADIDGDDKPDVVYSLALPSEDEFFWRPRYLIAAVSTRPGELLKLGESTSVEVEAVAAIDLNGDGADEVLVAEPYHEGNSVYVGRFANGTLEALGGWGCGL